MTRVSYRHAPQWSFIAVFIAVGFACDGAPDTGMFPSSGLTDVPAADAADVQLEDAVDGQTVDTAPADAEADLGPADTGVAPRDVAPVEEVSDDSSPSCPEVCLNGGACVAGECVCPESWQGAACEKPVCESGCGGRGQCVSPNVCACESGWYGAGCEIAGPTWSLVPAGSFTSGSPTTELGRVPIREDQRLVTVTRDFIVMDTEVPRGLWAAIAVAKTTEPIVPSEMSGSRDTLPVTNLTWWSAVGFANYLSELSGLRPCYRLSATDLRGCGLAAPPDPKELELMVFRGVAECAEQTPSAFDGGGDMLDCEGWRLPTEAEWEYAARMTRGGVPIAEGMYDAMGRGTQPPKAPADCDPGTNALIHAVAWWCGDTGTLQEPGPVNAKAPTDLGLHGVLGNVSEWVWDRFDEAPVGEPAPATQVDPRRDSGPAACDAGGAEVNRLLCRVRRGGSYRQQVDVNPFRFAHRAGLGMAARLPSVGLRLVRTVPSTE